MSGLIFTWIYEFTKECSAKDKKPTSIANSLVMLVPENPDTYEPSSAGEEESWLAEHMRDYNLMIHQAISNTVGLAAVRNALKRAQKKESTKIADIDYGELLVKEFLIVDSPWI